MTIASRESASITAGTRLSRRRLSEIPPRWECRWEESPAGSSKRVRHPPVAQNDALVVAIDRLLFVLMVVEILHTVRVSFRSGTLVCEPFLIVGLIASIRRVLVITLESSQVNEPGRWTADSQALLHATLLELLVLALLILVMVASIYLLRRSKRQPVSRRIATRAG